MSFVYRSKVDLWRLGLPIDRHVRFLAKVVEALENAIVYYCLAVMEDDLYAGSIGKVTAFGISYAVPHWHGIESLADEV